MRAHFLVFIFLFLLLENFRSDAQISIDTSLQSGQNTIAAEKKDHDISGLINEYLRLAHSQMKLSNYSMASNLFVLAVDLLDLKKNWKREAETLNELGNAQFSAGKNKNAISALNKSIRLSEENNLKNNLADALIKRGDVYSSEIDLHHSILDYKRALAIDKQINDYSGEADALIALGSIYMEGGDNYNGFNFYNAAIDLAREKGLTETTARALDLIERRSNMMNRFSYEDSERKSQGTQSAFIDLNKQLASYKRKAILDSIAQRQQMQEEFDKKQRQRELVLVKNKLQLSEQEKKIRDFVMANEEVILKNTQFEKQGKDKLLKISENEKLIQRSNDARLLHVWRAGLYSSLAALFLILCLSLILWRNISNKQKANRLLKLQKQQTESEKTKAEEALDKLVSTQAQLIQTEKMASLGQLTAGIAHEIQNPLNFVNNFSEINGELSDELSREVEKGNMDEIKSIARDIKDNSEKINHHGKRADAIVKGMLQHSRSGSGIKEPTDINALAVECLRLVYHGSKGSDPSFNVIMKTDLDRSIEKINIISQDIGRMLLNLYNNAFYSVNEKKKIADQSYQPTVSVSTRKENDKVILKVTDNGYGIPQKIIDKIFQPFFTTKPTGQGTGLGLSLTYDIVKAHGGEINVNTVENEGTVFEIELPITRN